MVVGRDFCNGNLPTVMVLKYISAFLLLLLSGQSTIISQPVDTVWIRRCVFNELRAEGIESPPQIWLRAPKALYDSAIILKYVPEMKRLDEIGKTIAPRPLADFAKTMLDIVSMPRVRTFSNSLEELASRYDLDLDWDIDSARLGSALSLAEEIQGKYMYWLSGYRYTCAGYLYALRKSDRSGVQPSVPFLTCEWDENLCEASRIRGFDFSLLQREDVRNGLSEALSEDSIGTWDSILVLVREREPCLDTGTFHVDQQLKEDDLQDDTSTFVFVEHIHFGVPPDMDSIRAELEKSQERRDSIYISSILHDTRGSDEFDTVIYRLSPLMSIGFTEQQHAALMRNYVRSDSRQDVNDRCFSICREDGTEAHAFGMNCSATCWNLGRTVFRRIGIRYGYMG